MFVNYVSNMLTMVKNLSLDKTEIKYFIADVFASALEFILFCLTLPFLLMKLVYC